MRDLPPLGAKTVNGTIIETVRVYTPDDAKPPVSAHAVAAAHPKSLTPCRAPAPSALERICTIEIFRTVNAGESADQEASFMVQVLKDIEAAIGTGHPMPSTFRDRSHPPPGEFCASFEWGPGACPR